MFGENKGSALKKGLQSGVVKRLASVLLPMPGAFLMQTQLIGQGDELALAADAMSKIGPSYDCAAVGADYSLFIIWSGFTQKRYGSGGEDAGDFRNLAKTALDSKVLNMQGYAVSPESILARKSGIIPNNNNELLLKV